MDTWEVIPMKTRTKLLTLHRWLGTIIGLQLLVWTAGGLVFSSVDIDVVRGEHLSLPLEDQPVHSSPQWKSLETILKRIEGGALKAAHLTWRRGKWVWEIHGIRKGDTRLFAAQSGIELALMDKAEAMDTVSRRLTEDLQLKEADLVISEELEYRDRPLPAWRIHLHDAMNSRVYLDALTGETTVVRSNRWHLFNFFWMLHIMDYSERKDIQKPWLRIAAILGVLTSASGLCLAAARLGRGSSDQSSNDRP